ncbi:fanconi-associated nuclease 1 homolog isoform X2 [Primulina huaijiensis]|uniref:fanconi-associated nuclease 1 homolog isoform X2 n=1 Tax=Primulina huaijiensis TaxID=1492673 RepID=UPI003CC77099
MLTGRESLVRLIGKRRRFLPNRRTILSSSSLSSSQDEKQKKDAIGESSGFASESEKCPVCGTKFPAQDNASINSHLDVCLAKGGSKRKLSQLTLLQLSFSRSKVKGNCDLQPAGQHLDHSNPIASSTRDKIHDINESDSFGGCGNEKEESTYGLLASRKNPTASSIGNPFPNESDYEEPASRPLISKRAKYMLEDCLDDFDISKVFIPTFIVGRRYGRREELDPESRICLSRDPDNFKDPNAIKVIYADFDDNNVLGYLPRELAQYLSPLICMFDLTLEGSITFVPKDYRAAVPIQIVCKNVHLCDKKYRDNVQDFMTLWRHVLNAVELAKTSSPGMIRYQHNMVLIILEVLKSSAHVFTISEKSFLESFILLSDDSQRLFARLYTRKGPWFRISNVSYPEVADLTEAIKGLSEPGYVCVFPSKNEVDDNDLEEVLNVLNTDELREALNMLNKKRNQGTRKKDMINLLLSSCKGDLCTKLQTFFLARTGTCVRVSPLAESLIWRIERLFFLNGEQDLSTFLLVDLGIVKYPAYNCIISEQIFSNRSDLLSFEESVEVAQIMVEAIDESNDESVLRCLEISVSNLMTSFEEGKYSTDKSMASFVSRFSASWTYSKVVLLGVSFLEREKRYSDAINLLRRLLNTFVSDGRRGYWVLRLSVNLEHLGRLEESLQTAEDGLLDPWVRAGSRVALQRRVLRLGKPPRRWKIPSYSSSIKRKIAEVHIQGKPLNRKAGMKSIFYSEDGEQCGVEQLALEYYSGEGGGWHGVHAESGIWLTIVGILLWDIIFADVPNVFRTKFQTAPLDLETDNFYEARKGLIEELLDKIREGMAEEILITAWESHFGTACRGVNWEKHSLSDLRAVVTCMGGVSLAAICRHLAQDYRSWSSGMPDLLLWRLHDCYKGEAKLVEVKGPNDRLSEQQRAWLLVLINCGFNVEVCKVTPAPEPIS